MNAGIATHCALTRGLESTNRPAHVTRMVLGWRKSRAAHRIGTLATRACGALERVTLSGVKAGGRMPQWHAFAERCAGTLVLLTPSSFVVVAVPWDLRHRVLSSTNP